MGTNITKTTTVTTRYVRTVTAWEVLKALGAPMDATITPTGRYDREFTAEDTFEITWQTTEETEEP